MSHLSEDSNSNHSSSHLCCHVREIWRICDDAQFVSNCSCESDCWVDETTWNGTEGATSRHDDATNRISMELLQSCVGGGNAQDNETQQECAEDLCEESLTQIVCLRHQYARTDSRVAKTRIAKCAIRSNPTAWDGQWPSTASRWAPSNLNLQRLLGLRLQPTPCML